MFYCCGFRLCRVCCFSFEVFFFFKQKTAYEVRISDWSSDVCSSDLVEAQEAEAQARRVAALRALSGRASVPIDDILPMGEELAAGSPIPPEQEIGRASCRERVCQYV